MKINKMTIMMILELRQEWCKSQDVEDFVPVYQDTTDPATQFKTLLANTGFAIRSASISGSSRFHFNLYLKEMWGCCVHFHFPEPKPASLSTEVNFYPLFSFFDTLIDKVDIIWLKEFNDFDYFPIQGCQSLPRKDSPGTLIFWSTLEQASIPIKRVQN